MHFKYIVTNIFLTKIYFNITSCEIKNVIFLAFDFLNVLAYHSMQKIVKIFINNDVIEV
jgi:hypothetical protein